MRGGLLGLLTSINAILKMFILKSAPAAQTLNCHKAAKGAECDVRQSTTARLHAGLRHVCERVTLNSN